MTDHASSKPVRAVHTVVLGNVARDKDRHKLNDQHVHIMCALSSFTTRKNIPTHRACPTETSRAAALRIIRTVLDFWSWVPPLYRTQVSTH